MPLVLGGTDGVPGVNINTWPGCLAILSEAETRAPRED